MVVRPMYTLVLIQHQVEQPYKIKLITECQPVPLGENYTEKKRDSYSFVPNCREEGWGVGVGGGLNKIYMGESYQDFLKCIFVGVGGEKGVLGSLSHNNFFSPKICNLTLPLQLCSKGYSLPRKFCQKYFKRKQTLSQNI